MSTLESPVSQRPFSALQSFLTRTGILPVVLLYVVVVLTQACSKLLWIDELITFYIARQAGIRGIWNALALGSDPNPPLLHLLVQWSTRWLGVSSLAIRLPSILASLLAVVAIWSILRRWLSPAFAASGALAYMATRGFDYSYDARSYALLSGFAMAAFWLWLIASERPGLVRTVAVFGVALALAAGVSSNYYGVLAFLPIAAAEATRSFQCRRFQPGVWFALLAGLLPLLVYQSLIRHNIAEFGPHAWNRTRGAMLGDSYLVLVEGILWLTLALALWAWRTTPSSVNKERKRIPMPVQAAIWAFLLYPFLGLAVALGGAGMISARCVAPVCCGFGLAVGILGQRTLGRFRNGGSGLVLLLVVWVLAHETACWFILADQREAFLGLRDRVSAAHGQVLLADSSLALPLYFYSAPAVRSQLIFPIDFDQIHRFEPDDSGEQNLWAGRAEVFPLRIEPFAEYHSDGHEILAIAHEGGWLVDSLGTSGITCNPLSPTTEFFRMGGVIGPMAHFEDAVLRCSPAPGP